MKWCDSHFLHDARMEAGITGIYCWDLEEHSYAIIYASILLTLRLLTKCLRRILKMYLKGLTETVIQCLIDKFLLCFPTFLHHAGLGYHIISFDTPILKMTESPFSFAGRRARTSLRWGSSRRSRPYSAAWGAPHSAQRRRHASTFRQGLLTNHVHSSIVGFVGYPLSHNLSLSHSRNLSVLLTASWVNPLSH